jgi:hypothetical protein
MKATFVIITVADRLEQLNGLLRSIEARKDYSDIDINIMFQGPEEYIALIKGQAGQRCCVYHSPEKLGCHGARVRLLKLIEADRYAIYINLDDDMVLGAETNYRPAFAMAMQRKTGFVLTNWARTRKMLEVKIPKMRNVFVPQIMLYNGGGMIYGNHVADLMRQLPEVKTAFDCAWSITAYVNGLRNLRYLGSLTEHNICGTGGMSAFMASTPLHVMAKEYLNFRMAKKRNGSCKDVLIPLDADVLPLAKELHAKNRRRLDEGLPPIV